MRGTIRIRYLQAYLATLAYRTNPDNASTVHQVSDNIDYSTSVNSPIYMVMRGLVQGIILLIALSFAFFAVLWTILMSANSGSDHMWAASITDVYAYAIASPLIVSAMFGMLGSIVSVLLRLSEFEGATRRSPQFLKMTGFVLPLVGAVFAAVTAALFSSGIINFSFTSGGNAAAAITNPSFYVVIGFLAGFSERFTRGLLGRAEDIVASATTSRTAVTQSPDGTTQAMAVDTTVRQKKAPA